MANLLVPPSVGPLSKGISERIVESFFVRFQGWFERGSKSGFPGWVRRVGSKVGF